MRNDQQISPLRGWTASKLSNRPEGVTHLFETHRFQRKVPSTFCGADIKVVFAFNSRMNWEPIFEEKIRSVATVDDPAHDLAHFKRVVATAKKLAEAENAKLEVVIPAAWLHDLVIIPKNDPRRSQASRMSGVEAMKFLGSIGYPPDLHDDIAHAVEAHSFSANIDPRTKEAAVVQDADRLDGLGAIGLARVFATAGMMKRAFYSDDDPFCTKRKPDDQRFTIDHFFVKLFKTAETLKTEAGRKEGRVRVERMKSYLKELASEIEPS